MTYQRHRRSHFASLAKPKRNRKKGNDIIIEHNYVSGHVCVGDACNSKTCLLFVEKNEKRTGMPCFTINTKLGTAMIDSIGGPGRVNNFLSTFNIPTINDKTLKGKRAGDVIETVSKEITRKAASDAYKMEMA
ncbi:uncharacterized protein [Argopecten irradians]|uniref:uncharacterized protein n=1 Tax=Argopecten irradians TaxID=31199 RepID=UPI0037110F5A